MKTNIRIPIILATLSAMFLLASGCGQGPAVVKTVEPSPRTAEGRECNDLKPLK